MITAVIATKNNETTIAKTIRSLINNVDNIVVMYAKCTDETVRIVQSFYGVKNYFDRNAGFFGSYDAGWRKVNSDYYMFIDADAFFDERFFSTDYLKGFSNKDVGIIVYTHRAVISNNLSKIQDSWFEHRRGTIYKWQHKKQLSAWERFYFRFFFSSELHSGSVVTGPCYVIKRAVLEKMSGLPHNADDFCLGRLLEKVGYKVYFETTPYLYHYPRITYRELLRQYLTFGLHYSPNAKNFYTLKERICGMFNYPLSFGVAILVIRIKPDPRQIFILPLVRLVQFFGSILGFSFKEAKDVKVRRFNDKA